MYVGNYEIKEELGRGTFGVTYLGYDTVNDRNVAIKTIDINKSKQLGADLTSIEEEIQTLKDLSKGQGAEYVAQYYDNFTGNLAGVPTIFIVSEYIDGSSLTSFINKYSPNVRPKLLWNLFMQLFLGLKHIHDSGYAHRDIKPDNILLTKDLKIKYIDFGLACLEQCKIYMCKNTCTGKHGTLLFMPPEFFNGTNESSLRGAKAHDIWSLTMVLWELSSGSGYFPFAMVDNYGNFLAQNQIIYNITKSTPNANYLLDDGTTNNFLDSLLVLDWELRPTIDQIITVFSDIFRSMGMINKMTVPYQSTGSMSSRRMNVDKTVPYQSMFDEMTIPRQSMSNEMTVPYQSMPNGMGFNDTVPYQSMINGMVVNDTVPYQSMSPRRITFDKTIPYQSMGSSSRRMNVSGTIPYQSMSDEMLFNRSVNQRTMSKSLSPRRSLIPKPSEIGKQFNNSTLGYVDIIFKQY